jgi:hypothetical protein
MDTGTVYQKTRKGEDEIKARGAKLSQKLRTMLILIDGSKNLGQLGGLAKQLGVAEDYIALLEGQGLIAKAGPAPAADGGRPAATPRDEFQRFSAAQRFMNETVVNALGMRSFFFTLKLEKCSTRAELRELLEDYGKAIAKGAGADEAAVLTERAREMLE